MQIRPILAALRKHKLATFLIAMEIALACAVLVNAVFLIVNRLSAMDIVSGVDESSLGTIVVTGFGPKDANDLNARMLAGLRGIAGVESVHVVSSVPFGPQGGVNGITLDQEGKHFGAVVQTYQGEAGSPEALGLKLVAGHLPAADDYQPILDHDYMPLSSRVLVTQALAEKLWPGANPLGKEFWGAKYRFRVIGVVANLSVSQYTENGEHGAQWCVFVPVQAGGQLAGTYLIRAKPGDLERVMTEARAAVAKIAPDVVLDYANSQTIGHLRERFFRNDRAMAGLLVGVIVALLGVTAFGIVGLASFWVAQRRKQIGIRRALGATRADILRYFQTENFLIVTFGIVVGVVLAIGINIVLMKFFEVPRLPLWYLPVGVVVLWLLGQLAVLVPALRAAAVPPVVATRSV
ncbi:MAG TPA: FtsX-like permease family protein [Rhodanobacteraceae bacterium]|jgi:putative ABC transport system permease protein|nr:FtsX-like permease family protein [Rhodanobacteraceae bacterium]